MKNVVEDNKWTLDDYSTDVIECIALSNIAGYSSSSVPLVLKAYSNTKSLLRRPVRITATKVTLNNHSNTLKKLSANSYLYNNLYYRSE